MNTSMLPSLLCVRSFVLLATFVLCTPVSRTGALTTSSPTSVAFSGVAPDPAVAPESSGDFWSD